MIEHMKSYLAYIQFCIKTFFFLMIPLGAGLVCWSIRCDIHSLVHSQTCAQGGLCSLFIFFSFPSVCMCFVCLCVCVCVVCVYVCLCVWLIKRNRRRKAKKKEFLHLQADIHAESINQKKLMCDIYGTKNVSSEYEKATYTTIMMYRFWEECPLHMILRCLKPRNTTLT